KRLWLSLMLASQLFGSSTATAAGRPHIQRATTEVSTAASAVLSRRRNRGGRFASDRRSLSIFPVLPMDQRPGRRRLRPTGGYRRLALDGNANSPRIRPNSLEDHGTTFRQPADQLVGGHLHRQLPITALVLEEIHMEIIG